MDERAEELAAVIAAIRDRVRARYPNGSAAQGAVPLLDTMPLLHARDAAEGKVASIGTVNPRAPGLVNSLVQRGKRLIARALDWHVREQVEFNRAVIACVQATIENLNECNRSMAAVSARIDEVSESLRGELRELGDEARQLKDIRAHWAEWRVQWEKTLAATEIRFLRSVAELQATFQHRVTLMDENYRGQVKAQHAEFEGALARSTEDIQKRLWADLAKQRSEYEAVVHSELRILRQRTASETPRAVEPAAGVTGAQDIAPQIDWLKFAERFRGSEEAIRERQKFYAARFQGHGPVLDVGCGRGEMLEVLREAGIAARGVDSSEDSTAVCRSKGLDVEKADLFAYLRGLRPGALGGAVCCQVVEHLPPALLPELIHLLHEKLRPGAVVAIETPNPECLAIFATHFYLDPTHRHPIPPALLQFYLEEAGFGAIDIERLSPAVEAMPSVAALPEKFRKEFFGALDYVAFATRLG